MSWWYAVAAGALGGLVGSVLSLLQYWLIWRRLTGRAQNSGKPIHLPTTEAEIDEELANGGLNLSKEELYNRYGKEQAD